MDHSSTNRPLHDYLIIDKISDTIEKEIVGPLGDIF